MRRLGAPMLTMEGVTQTGLRTRAMPGFLPTDRLEETGAWQRPMTRTEIRAGSRREGQV